LAVLKKLTRDKARREALDKLPRGLPETYKRILDRLEDGSDSLEIAKRALAWLLYSLQPLRLSHLATAASVDPNMAFDEEQRVDEDENILDFIGPLIKTNNETKVVEFSHISVIQFLTKSKLSDGTDNPYYLDEAEGNALLMRACFMYLCSPSFSTIISHLRDSESIIYQLRLRFQDEFSIYAVREWPRHVKKIEEKLNVCHILEFLKKSSFLAWREMWELRYLHNYQWSSTREIQFGEQILWSHEIVCELQSAARWDSGSPLYYAALLNLQSVAEVLLDDHDPNTCGGPESYALLAALKNCHTTMAELLLRRGADVNVKSRFTKDTALHQAVKSENLVIAKFLIDHGADVTVCNLHGFPPLHLAVQSFIGRPNDLALELIKLLAGRSNIDVKDRRRNTVVHLAAGSDNSLLISALMKQGANVNAINRDKRVPLHVASRKGYLKMVEMLLIYKADVKIEDCLGYTPFHEAVRSGNPKLVERLSQEFRILFKKDQLNRCVYTS
jgi:ankyrin repeat protein